MESVETYTHEMIIRDVVYYYHECSAYLGVAYDLDYTPLLGPYWAYFGDDDDLVKDGTMLLFIGMLREWDSGAGVPFGRGADGQAVHPFPAYLASLLDVYEASCRLPGTPRRDLYEVALSLCAQLDHDGAIAGWYPDLAPDSLGRLRSLVDAGQLFRPTERWGVVYGELYAKYIRPYYIARCQ